MKNSREHWDNVYATKAVTEVSWYEPMPEISLKCIADFELAKDDPIIDVGGGDSFLAEFLLAKGYTDVTVLDISQNAIDRAQKRLAEKAEEIAWITKDIVDLVPEKEYKLWHDRAALHFLTEDSQVEQYLQVLRKALRPNGFAVIATFSEKGPAKCSGLEVRRYSIAELQRLFSDGFTTLNCRNVDHETPSGKLQNFTVCCFQKD